MSRVSCGFAFRLCGQDAPDTAAQIAGGTFFGLLRERIDGGVVGVELVTGGGGGADLAHGILKVCRRP